MREVSMIEDQKADFNHIYAQPDPRAYFSTLSGLDYQIPQQALYGLVTEQVPEVTYPQRRFADRREQAAATHDVQLRGLDPRGKESAGWFHANCFISRPAATVAQTPVTDLLAGVL